MADVKLEAILTLKDKMTSGLKGSEKSLNNFGKTALKAGAIVGGLAVGIGTAAVKAAADFEKQMSDVSTLISGDSTKAVAQLSDGIRKMMMEVPVSADELGASAYAIVSAGISDTSEALQVLEASSRLAVAGLGTAAEATDIMTSALNAFGYEAAQSNKVSDILFKTVKSGKTTVSELAQSFGASAPVIAAAGITLEDFSAATAALTTTGLPASQAQMGLRQAIVALQKPTKDMSDLFQKLGVKDGQQLIATSKNMGDVFNKLKTATAGNNEQWAKAIGSVEALTVVTGILGEQSESYNGTLADMQSETNAIDEAFAKQKETAQANYQLFKNQLNVVLINLGEKILPTLNQVMSALPGIIDWVSEKWNNLVNIISNMIITVWNVTGGIQSAFDYIKGLFQGLLDRTRHIFNQFKDVITKPFTDAWNGIKDVVDKIKDGLDRINPFHKESPSLVENVQKGLGIIKKEFQSLGNIEVKKASDVTGVKGVSTVGKSFSNNVSITIPNATVRSEADLQTIIQAVTRAINRELQLTRLGV